MQVSETFHSILKSRKGICDESRSLVVLNFLEFRIFELFATKARIFKQGLGGSRTLPFTACPTLPPEVALDRRTVDPCDITREKWKAEEVLVALYAFSLRT